MTDIEAVQEHVQDPIQLEQEYLTDIQIANPTVRQSSQEDHYLTY
jgi:hypothetical protein